jgi:hypothetical protein
LINFDQVAYFDQLSLHSQESSKMNEAEYKTKSGLENELKTAFLTLSTVTSCRLFPHVPSRP